MTLFTHIKLVYDTFVHRKNWVSDEKLRAQLTEMPQVILLSEMRQAFPEMHKAQLRFLARECYNKAQVVSRVGMSASYTAQMVAGIHMSLHCIEKDLKEMK